MPLVQNPSIGAGAAPLLMTTTQLTRAQILTLHSVPVQLVPAPGAGNLILVFFIAAIFKFGTVGYEAVGSTDSLSFLYANTGDEVASAMADLVTSAASIYSMNSTNGVSENSILPGDDNQAIQINAQASYNVGPISATTLGAGGLGYLANDTGTITNGANDATYKVLTVGAGGAVLTFQITGAGTACSVANGNATVDGGAQPGVGVGFTVNITAVATGDGTLKVVTYYQIIPVP